LILTITLIPNPYPNPNYRSAGSNDRTVGSNDRPAGSNDRPVEDNTAVRVSILSEFLLAALDRDGRSASPIDSNRFLLR
jgi:hypothetical protein